ncbi:MAG: ATP-binding cassette domain-containing protein [Rickettsiaceae bacterium]|nr:ATP-binding cassette domain-containing protein [Rickettsiaceae bacterium]
MNNFVIETKKLSKNFGQHKVLNELDLKVERGKALVILGGSGTGKSVLIKTIIGLMKPSSGEIIVDGIDITKQTKKEHDDFLRRCGFLFQGGALFDSLNIEDNITFFASRIRRLTSKEKAELASEKLHSVGLDDRLLGLYPSELSGGMQKRVALARTICTNPEIIFFDEPTTGLDPIMSNVINELIIRATDKLGATSVTITHDMNSARLIADKIAMIHGGKIIWEGTSDNLSDSGNPIVDQFVKGATKGPIEV